MGAVGVSHYDGVTSPAYDILQPVQELHSDYYHFLFRTKIYLQKFKSHSRGIMEMRLRLYFDQLGKIPALVPPIPEQVAIVRFLDYANSRIDRYIRAKKKLIALMNAQKQVVIHNAVTRGLDDNVRLKPSGIAWLGDIPEHWEVKRNDRLFRERIQRGLPGLPILVVSLRTGVTIASRISEDGRERRLIADSTAYKFADRGDIAYNMMRMWQGAVGVVPTPGLVSPAYIVAQPLSGANSGYYELLFRTNAYKGEINRNSRGIVSDRNRLYWGEFKHLLSPQPPVEEQIQIVQDLSAECAEVDLTISRTQHEIDLIREYRTRLIADVVTGKLDVREAAAKLPDETDSLEELEANLSPDEDIEETEFTDAPA